MLQQDSSRFLTTRSSIAKGIAYTTNYDLPEDFCIQTAWDEVPEIMKNSVAKVANMWLKEYKGKNSKEQSQLYEKIMKISTSPQYKTTKCDKNLIGKQAALYAFLKTMDVYEILQKFSPGVVIYDPYDEKLSVSMLNVVSSFDHSKTLIMKGIYVDTNNGISKEVCVKYMIDQDELRREIDFYEKLNKLEDSVVPWNITTMKVFDCNVLVMESMKKLDDSDDYRAVGRSIIFHLETIHNSDILHGDMKPPNIMKKMSYDGIIYKLIDFGGALGEKEKRKSTFQRRSYTSNYVYRNGNEIEVNITPKIELYELLHSMQAIFNGCTRTPPTPGSCIGCTSGFSGCLLEFHEHLKNLPNYPSHEDYDALRKILS